MSHNDMSKKEPHMNPQDLHSEIPQIKRRDFLRDSIVAATGVAVTVATGTTISSVVESNTVDTQKTDSNKKDSYRLTKHIADYYKSAAI